MVRGVRSVGVLLGFVLAGCASKAPGTFGSGEELTPVIGGATDTTHKAVFGMVINDRALCSSSLIAPNLLLTAGHCVAPLSTGSDPIDCSTTTFANPYAPSQFIVTYDSDLTNGVPDAAAFGVAAVRVPPDDTFCGNDIALLILDTNVPAASSPTIEPRVDDAPITEEAFSVVGYGLSDASDDQGETAGVRRSASGMEVGCVGAVACEGTRARNSEWAAITPICQGDSGGPALDADGRVIGVASRADEACEVGLYSSVSSWKALIVATALEAAERGGYDPPGWATGEPVMDGGAPQAGAGGTGGTGSGGTSGRAAGGASSTTGGGTATGGSATGGTASAGRGQAGGSTSAGTSSNAGRASQADAGVPVGGGDLGDECDGICSGSLRCYTSNGKPPGTCVPTCSSSNPDCPDGYTCATELRVCAPIKSSDPGDDDDNDDDDDDDKDSSSGCGCRVVSVSDGTEGAWQALGMLTALGGLARRRRRSRAAT